MAKDKKKLKKRMHILCEGEKTEPFYLKGYIATYANDKATVICVPETKYNTPVALVDEAIRLKNSWETSSDDEFWVVYDREAKSKYSDSLHSQARDKASSNNVNIAFSNICFELWLLQHFGYRNTPYSCCDDLIKNSPLKNDLEKIGISNYNKNNPHIFSKLKGGVARARLRAAQLNIESQIMANKETDPPHMLSSYTDVHLLLDAIDEFTP